MAVRLKKRIAQCSAVGALLLPCAAVFAGEPGASDMLTAPQVPLVATFTTVPSVEVRDERLYLGKVATCKGAAEICDEAAAVDLGPAPAPGRTTMLTRTKLQAMLAVEWDGAKVDVAGTEQVKVTSSHIDIDADMIRSRLVDDLAAVFDADARFAVAVEKVSISGKAKLRSVDYAIDFPQLSDLKSRTRDWLVRHINGTHSLQVRFTPQGPAAGEPAFATASVAFVLSERLPVARRGMTTGEVLTADAFEEAWVVIGKGRQSFVDKATSLAGKRLKRPVAVGAPVQLNQLEVPAVVRRGELVTLKMNGGGVAVSGQVKALADGGYGEAIEVMMIATKKRLRARVVDEDTVEYMR